MDLAARRLRALALLGLATSAAEAWLWQLWLDPVAHRAIFGILARQRVQVLPFLFVLLCVPAASTVKPAVRRSSTRQ